MNLKTLSQLFSLGDIRNAIIGLSVVIGGIGLAVVTIWAQQTGNNRLAGYAAAASLVFVLITLIFIVPPLARNPSAEASQMNLPFELTGGGAMILGLIASPTISNGWFCPFSRIASSSIRAKLPAPNAELLKPNRFCRKFYKRRLCRFK